MRVLHVYSQDNQSLTRYVSLLAETLQGSTGSDTPQPERRGGSVECAFAASASELRSALRDFQPDIVHQHGQLPFPVRLHDSSGTPVQPLLAMFHYGAFTPPPRLVISPHGEKADTERAYVVIARSPFELSQLKAPRKELVRNPLITTTITFDEAAALIRNIYQRVFDSHPLELMDAPTRYALAILLKAGLLGDKRWVADAFPHIESQDADAPSTIESWFADANINFHHLFIYARLESVLDIALRGLSVLGIDQTAPSTAPSPAPSSTVGSAEMSSWHSTPFLPEDFVAPAPLPSPSVVALLRDIEQNGITLLRLTELTQALHSDTLDEKALMQLIEAEKLKPLFQSVLQLLVEQTLLSEGFMPCAPEEDALTQNLRTTLYEHLRLTPNS